MIVPTEITSHYSLVLPQVKWVRERVRQKILSLTEENGYAFSSRIKSLESLAEKIEGGRIAKWADVDDMFACTVVIPSLREENHVLEFLRASFDEVALKQRGSTLKDPSVFRFDATRFIGYWKPATVDTTSGEPVSQIKFEVQVRTAFEHAWSVATHAESYKPNSVSWQRLRLAAQMKAAVEQLDQLILAYDQALDPIVPHAWPELAARADIEKVLRSRLEAGTVPTEARPQSLYRLADNLFQLLRSFYVGPRHELRKHVKAQVRRLDKELAGLAGKYPMSITLLQIAVGVFAADLANGASSFHALVTPALESLYPDTKNIRRRFDLASAIKV